MARWSTPISPAARSIIWSASRCRRCCGESCPGARSAGRVQSVALRLVCDRELEIEKFVAREYWSLVATLATPRNETFEARLVGADGQQDPAPRHRLGRGSRAIQARSGERRLHRQFGRGQARAAQSLSAVHDLDGAAGGEPQVRLRAGAYHAARAAALRRRRHRRRDRRPHHLYANRRRRYRAGSDHRGPPRHREPTTASTTCRPRRASTSRSRRTPRRPTRRSARPISRGVPRTSRKCSTTIRPGSTS